MDFENLEEQKAQIQRKKAEEIDKDREKAGHKAEREAFDEVKKEDYEKYVAQKKKELGPGSHPEEMYFNIYRDAVKESQPYKNPTDPAEKMFPRDLHTLVAQELGLKNFEQLRFYTAVGSDLDIKYGADAFLELDLGNGKTIDVTMDITLKPEHAIENKYKADIYLLSWEKIPFEVDKIDDSDEVRMQKRLNRKKWDDRTKVFARMVGETFKDKAIKKGLEIRPLEVEEIESSQKAASTGFKREIRKERGLRSIRDQRVLKRQSRRQVA